MRSFRVVRSAQTGKPLTSVKSVKDILQYATICILSIALSSLFGFGCGDDDPVRVLTSGDLRVLVSELDGEPTADAWVVIQESAFAGAATDSSGTVVFSDLEPGSYRALASKSGRGGGAGAWIEAGQLAETQISLSPRSGLEPNLHWKRPRDDDAWGFGQPLLLEGRTDPVEVNGAVQLSLEDMLGNVLGEGAAEPDGLFEFSVESPAAKGEYQLLLRATNAIGFSTRDSIAIPVTIVPPTLDPIRFQDGALQLSWSVVVDPDLQGYEVWRFHVGQSEPAETVQIASLDPGTTTYGDTTFPRAVAVEYRIRTLDAGGHHSWSEPRPLDTPAGSLLFTARIGDAVLHPDQPTLYVMAGDLRTLYSVDLTTESITDSLVFDFRPGALSIGDTGTGLELYVSIPGQNSGDVENGYIAILDPEDLSLIDLKWMDMNPYDVLAGRDGFLYVTSNFGTSPRVKSYPRQGHEDGFEESLDTRILILHPVFDRLYAVGSALDIDQGHIGRPRDILYGGSQNSVDPLGRYLFGSRGDVFRCDIDLDRDVTFFGRLPVEWSAIAFDETTDRVFTAVGERIHVFSMDTWEELGVIDLPMRISRMFHRDNSLVVLGFASSIHQTELMIVDDGPTPRP